MTSLSGVATRLRPVIRFVGAENLLRAQARGHRPRHGDDPRDARQHELVQTTQAEGHVARDDEACYPSPITRLSEYAFIPSA